MTTEEKIRDIHQRLMEISQELNNINPSEVNSDGFGFLNTLTCKVSRATDYSDALINTFKN